MVDKNLCPPPLEFAVQERKELDNANRANVIYIIIIALNLRMFCLHACLYTVL